MRKTSVEKYIGKTVEISIDRPIGSKHPKYGYAYPVNYVYVPGTIAGDSEELDAYALGPNVTLATFKGRRIAAIKRHDDDDDKLVVVSDGANPTDEEIEQSVEFQEKWFRHILLRKKT
ncbi:MAG: inorganic diphosphatase [Rickettsiales bacterium]|jgi:inorganic pyrophosphatase|nr:inorganic diphosphatase [Rickettsiales bacterium]